jgi:hypothetical protein
MSSEHNHAPGNGSLPINKDVNFESKDINVRSILLYLLALAVSVAIAFGVTVLILRVTEKMAVDSDRVMPPSHKDVGATMPPEPMLQGVPGHTNDPQEDLREKIASDTKANEQLGWVDRSAGIAQIPVEDAMKIIVSKGLSPGAAPATEKSK